MNYGLRMLDKFKILGHYLKAKRTKFLSRDSLLAHQQKKMKKYIREQLIKAPFYVDLIKNDSALPIANKQVMMDNFEEFNTLKISKSIAMPIALKSEEDRNFSPMIDNVTVGLSSGTTANRGLFLVSKKERLKWAGIILAKCLPNSIFKKTKIAFFLRANSNLYTTLKSSRIEFQFFDIFEDFDVHIKALKNYNPDVLVAPAQVLKYIAMEVETGVLKISPKKIISCAEVLTSEDKKFIENVFDQTVHEIYQATEGFLAATCEFGSLHLNEEYIHIAKEWVDEKEGRFIPIISDFSRTSQIIWNYKLDDILVASNKPCECGNATQVIKKIEGRCGDVLKLQDMQGEWHNIFPDTAIRLISLLDDKIKDFRLIQNSKNSLILTLKGEIANTAELKSKFCELLSNHFELQGVAVDIEVVDDFIFNPSVKVRRIQNNYIVEEGK